MDKDELIWKIRAIDREHRPVSISVVRDSITCQCGHESIDPDGLALHRATLIVEELGLSEDFALAYESKRDPTMDNPSGIGTHHHVLPSREIAERAVASRIPGGSRSEISDRRVERRFVTDWERLD